MKPTLDDWKAGIALVFLFLTMFLYWAVLQL